MVGERRRRVLDLGSGGCFAQCCTTRATRCSGWTATSSAVAHLAERLGTRLHVAGQVESLPYLSCHFDVVTASQTLHRFAPGLALTEIARVLRPGGHLAVAYNTRDDTVPWVRRLTALMRRPTRRRWAATSGPSRRATSPRARTSPSWSGVTSATGCRSPGRAWSRWCERQPSVAGSTRPAGGPARRGRGAVRLVRPAAGAAAAAVPGVLLAGRGRPRRSGAGRGRGRRSRSGSEPRPARSPAADAARRDQHR